MSGYFLSSINTGLHTGLDHDHHQCGILSRTHNLGILYCVHIKLIAQAVPSIVLDSIGYTALYTYSIVHIQDVFAMVLVWD